VAHSIVEQLERSLEATLRVAEACPDDQRGFYPVPGCMTADEQIEHMAHNFDWVIEPIADTLGITCATDKPGPPLDHLEWSQRRFLDVLSEVPDVGWDRKISYPEGFGMSVARGALVMLEHDAHHRGQLIIYLHLLEVEVPKRWPRS